MIPDAVAVITYPGHCISTALTIKNLLEISNWAVPVYIFVDDQSEQYQTWPGNYLQDIKQYYAQCFPNLPLRYVLFSEFEFTHIWDGWLRQQMVKLNLDRFLTGDIWYVTDGDVYIKELLSFESTPFNYVPDRNRQIHAQNRSYLQHMLKTTNILLEKDGRLLFTHHAPFRWIQRFHLLKLREYVSRIHVNDFNLVHIQLMREERIIGFGPTDASLSMTEWDLIEVFRANILEEDIGLKYWPLRTDTDVENQARFWTFFGTDRDIDISWFENFNLNVPNDLQQKIQLISRT